MEMLLFEQDIGHTKSSVKLLIKGEMYIIDGYDRGEAVKEMFGGFGYEYSLSFHEEELKKLDIEVEGNESIKDAFLKRWIKSFINDPSCFSKIKTALDEKEVQYESFYWQDAY